MPNELAKVSEVASLRAVVPEGPTSAQTRATIDPQRLLRIAAVARGVLAEARRVAPEPGTVDHLHRMLDRICGELEVSLPPQLYEELTSLTPDITEESLAQVLLAHAEIIGWLEGLFQAVQLALRQPRVQEPIPEVTEPSAGRDRPDPRYL